MQQRIREQRIARRLKQVELAVASGFSQSYINRIERNRIKNPSINTLKRIARGFKKLGFKDIETEDLYFA